MTCAARQTDLHRGCSCESLETRRLLADDPVTLDLLSTLDGPVRDVAVAGSRAYLATGHELQIIDVSSPNSPQLMGRINQPAAARRVAVSGTRAYVVSDGIQIIDVANPAAPVLIGQIGAGLETANVAVSGSLVCRVDTYIIELYDASNAASPTPLSYRFEYGSTDVEIVGDRLYAARGSRVSIYDISNPAVLAPLGEWVGNAKDVAVVGSLMYSAGDPSYDPILKDDVNMRIVDVSNPAAPVTRGLHRSGETALDIAVYGTRAYLSYGGAGLDVVNISSATAPVKVGAFDSPGSATNVALAGTTAFVADGSGGLQLLDVAPATPVPVGAYRNSNVTSAASSLIQGNRLYVADPQGLLIYDITDPASPHELGKSFTFGTALDVAVSGSLAYVATYFGLEIVDVSNAAAPVRLSRIGFGANNRGIAISGNYAYLAGSSLVSVDVHVPTAPTVTAEFELGPWAAWDVDAVGSIAYAVDGVFVRIVDFSDPANPVLRASLNTGTASATRGIDVAGGLAYVTAMRDVALPEGGFSGGLLIVDVSNPSSPVVIGRASAPGQPLDVTVVGMTAYIAGESKGLSVLDVSDPLAPRLLGSYDTPGFASKSAVSGTLVAVADLAGGVELLRTSGVIQPVEPLVQNFFFYFQNPNSLWLVLGAGTTTTATLDDLTLQNLTTGQTVTPASFSYDVVMNTLYVGFSGVLPDGNYRATLNAASIFDASGQHPSQDAVAEFFALAGDANRDRIVNVADLGILATNWQRIRRIYRQADFDFNGTVDANDLGILASNWQKDLTQPAFTQSLGTKRKPSAGGVIQLIDGQI
jgi:hypothetical protein